MEEKLEKKKKKKKKKKKEHDSDSDSDSDSDDEKEDPLTVIQRLQDEHETFLKRVARRRSAEHLLIATKALRCTRGWDGVDLATAWMLIVAQCSAIP